MTVRLRYTAQRPARSARGDRPAPARSAGAAAGAVVGAVVGAALLLGGCTSSGQDGVPGLRDEAGAAFVSGDSTVLLVPAEERGEPVRGLAGTTVDGGRLDVADLAGELVVLNVWGSWCSPCHAEAGDLVAAEAELGPATGARFVGINVRDRSPEAAAGFEEEYGISWPSFHDPDMQLLLRLSSDVPPNTVPATLVLDAEGRVAARLLGRVDRATLVGVVEDVAATAQAAP